MIGHSVRPTLASMTVPGPKVWSSAGAAPSITESPKPTIGPTPPAAAARAVGGLVAWVVGTAAGLAAEVVAAVPRVVAVVAAVVLGPVVALVVPVPLPTGASVVNVGTLGVDVPSGADVVDVAPAMAASPARRLSAIGFTGALAVATAPMSNATETVDATTIALPMGRRPRWRWSVCSVWRSQTRNPSRRMGTSMKR